MNKKAAVAAIVGAVLVGAVVAYSSNILSLNMTNTSTGNETQTESIPNEESAQDQNQEVVLTPLQESLQQSIEKLKSEGKPYPEVRFNSTSKMPTEEQITESIESDGSFEAAIVATTVIEYDGPAEAGKERWDDIIVESPGPPTTTVDAANDTEVLVRGNLTQRVIDEHPEIYGEGEGQYQYGEEPRTFVIDEAMVITFVESNATEHLLNVTSATIEPEIANITESSNTVMGFSFVPKKIDYTINPKVKVLFFTLAEAKAGFLLDMAFGLRLPVQVNVTHPESMVAGENYHLESSLTPLDFAAEDYERMGLPPENGQEFFSRFEVFLGLKVWVIGIPIVNYAIDNKVDLGEECTVAKGFDCQNFVTPFGSDENGVPREFPIPELKLDPDNTGLEYTLLGIISIGVGLMIDPELGSDKISAEWSAAGHASGEGQVVYSAASPSTYPIGPIRAVRDSNDTSIAQGEGTSAVITLDNYKFHLNRQLLTFYGNLQLELLGHDVAQTGYRQLMQFNFSKIFGEPVIGQHKGVEGITSTIPVNGDVGDNDIPILVTIGTDNAEYILSNERPSAEVKVSGQIDKSILNSGSQDSTVIVELYLPIGTLYQRVELPEGSTSLGTHGSGNFNDNGSGRYEFTFALSYEGTPHLDPGSYNYKPPAPAGNWTVKATYAIGQASAETTFEVVDDGERPSRELTIRTDKPSYSAGESVTVTGTVIEHGIWTAIVRVYDISIQVFNPNGSVYLEGLETVRNDENMSFEWSFELEPENSTIPGQYGIVATTQEMKAETSFEVTETEIAGNVVEGTDGNDVLNGTEGDDEIRALAGNDVLYGLGGNDRLFGDAGNDEINAEGNANFEFNYIEGGTGNDIIKLRQTSGEIYGGAGEDEIEVISDAGNLDSLLILGGPGNDYVYVGDLQAEIYGGEGEDEIHAEGEAYHIVYGGSEADRLFLNTDIGGELHGGYGNDYLESEGFDGNLYGGEGDDILNGPGSDSDDPDVEEFGYGSATLTGGPGADTFICSPDAFEEIMDFNAAEGDTIVNEADCNDY